MADAVDVDERLVGRHRTCRIKRHTPPRRGASTNEEQRADGT
jgi:hypothetical protein